MTPLTYAAMVVRVRRWFLEELGSGQPTDFVDSTLLSPKEIDEAWDEACHEQHMIVLDDAEKSGRLEDTSNEYMRRYLSRRDFNITQDRYEYDVVPSDVAKIIKLEVAGLRGLPVSPAMDRLIRTWPYQYGPGRNEIFWTLLAKGLQSPPTASDTARILRVYVYGNTLGNQTVAVPFSTQAASLSYYRLVTPIAYNSPPVVYTDTYDPWAEGPVHGAVARLQEKAQQTSDAMYHYAKAREFAHSIVSNTQAQAVAQQQQGPQS